MKSSSIRRVIFSTFVLLFGLSVFRVFLPKVIWYLGEYIAPEQMALLALGVFALSLLAPLMLQLFGDRGMLGLTAGGLALIYFGTQLADSAPLYLILSIVGLALFGWFLPYWQRSPRNHIGDGGFPVLALAFPMAFILDTAMRSLTWTYDLVWRHDPLARAVALIIVLITLALLWLELRSGTTEYPPQEAPLKYSLLLLGLGPFLYLVMAMLHNPASITALTGWSDLVANIGVNIFVILGALGCTISTAYSTKLRPLWAIGAGTLLVIALGLMYIKTEPTWIWAGLAAIMTWVLLGWLLGNTTNTSERKPGIWRTSLGIFLALVVLLLTIFLVAQFAVDIMPVIGGAFLALSAIWVSAGQRQPEAAPLAGPLRLVGAAALIALLVVAVWGLINRPSEPVTTHPTDTPLRVMTYNIHQGVDADLKVNLEAIAAVIEAEAPDVLALNEVNRARATNGFIDVLAYLSQRLDMPYIFGANYADGQYGNAVLTRYPVIGWENMHFKNNTTEVRGVLRVTLPAPEPITFFTTHLDHIEPPGDARLAQVGEMLSFWNGAPRSVILGDLNAEPTTPEIQLLYQVGLIDVLEANGEDQVFTFWYADPQPGQRIDYIFITPDLPFGDAWVPITRASDHLPVISEIGP